MSKPKTYPQALYVTHENPGADESFFDARPDIEQFAEIGETVEVAEYKLVGVSRVTAHVVAKPK